MCPAGARTERSCTAVRCSIVTSIFCVVPAATSEPVLIGNALAQREHHSPSPPSAAWGRRREVRRRPRRCLSAAPSLQLSPPTREPSGERECLVRRLGVEVVVRVRRFLGFRFVL